MISRFNYTDRIDLKPRMFTITVKDGPPRAFDIGWNFEGLVLPADARVYVEAMASGSPTVVRYSFGTVAERMPPSNGTDISELPGENVHFTVKLVDETEQVGRLVGLAENIRPRVSGEEGSSGRQSILPVQPVDMGERVWRLRFEQNRPYLQVNRHVPDIMHRAQNDPRFFALVYPEVIRQVLYRGLIIEGHYEVTNEDDNWKDQWLRYAISWHADGEEPPTELTIPLDDDSRQQLEDWIEEAVHGFCMKKGTANLVVTADEEAKS